MAYADFQYYKDTFLGNAIEEIEFPRLSLRASEYIDAHTGGVIPRLSAIPEEVQKAACAVAEKIQAYESKAEVTSESVGSYSVTYKTSDATYEQELGKVLRLYLGNTGLLYRGL